MDSILQILDRLNKSAVPYVLIGGMAARAHGSSINTQDVDVCILASDEHFRRIIETFADVHPRYRMHPDQPPLTPDHPWLRGAKNLYLRTDLGQLDLLGEITGLGEYNALAGQTVEMDFAGVTCRVLDIPALIEAKLRVGRPKDHYAVNELREILKRTQESRSRDAQQ